MTPTASQLEFSRLQAPRQDGSVLLEPPLENVPELVRENRRVAEQCPYDMQGRSLAEVSQLARRELLDAARRWTAEYRNVTAKAPDPQGAIYLAGHQPQMFHPGVWFKNFALGRMAARHGATAVNLIIDGDLVADTFLRVPSGSLAKPRMVPVAFDRAEPKVAYEERKVVDRELFASFGRRVTEQLSPLVAHPLMEMFWPMVERRSRQVDRLGACIAQARHQLEAAWGLQTLEVPQSWICRGEAFQWFVAHLLARLPQFREVYNRAIREYRQLHHIRSTSHPAPELAKNGEWFEAPLWVWTADEPHRRRLFVRHRVHEVVVSDGRAWEATLPLTPEGDATGAVARLIELQQGGVRIRPRALMTTLWARLALGDLFIHGIGGAKYDRVTDVLFERFFDRRPPGLMVVSATLLLPVERHMEAVGEAQGIAQELRRLAYHPEQFLDGADRVVAELMAEKRRWISTPQTRENARHRCRAIRAINETLQPQVEDRRGELRYRQVEMARRVEAERVLSSREYAFCLYPEETLRGFLNRS